MTRRAATWLRAVALRSLGEALTAYLATLTAVGALDVGHDAGVGLDGLAATHAQAAAGAAAGAAVVLRVILPALVRVSDRLRGVAVPDVPVDLNDYDLTIREIDDADEMIRQHRARQAEADTDRQLGLAGDVRPLSLSDDGDDD